MGRTIKTLTCQTCGKEFTTTRSIGRKFCSYACANVYLKTPENRAKQREKIIAARERRLARGLSYGFTSENNPSLSIERRKQISRQQTGSRLSTSTKSKIAESIRASLDNPEKRAEMAAAAKAKWQEPKYRKKIKASLRKTARRKMVDRSKEDRPYIIKRTDRVFSEYIRKRDAIDGYSICVTCKKNLSYAEAQCGHYVSRRYIWTRFDEQNAHVQCASCNMYAQGEMPIYTLFMLEKYGQKILIDLHEKSHNKAKMPNYQILELFDHYSKLVSELDA